MNNTHDAKPRTKIWPAAVFKEAREELGLSIYQLAELLETDPRVIRAIEAAPSSSTRREPAPRMVRLMEAYLAGYRPPDWPHD